MLIIACVGYIPIFTQMTSTIKATKNVAIKNQWAIITQIYFINHIMGATVCERVICLIRSAKIHRPNGERRLQVSVFVVRIQNDRKKSVDMGLNVMCHA